MTSAVLFDLGKVIVSFDLRRGYQALLPHCSYSVEEIPKRIGATDLVARFEMGKISPADFVGELSRILGLKVTYPQFCELWSSIFLPEPLLPEGLFTELKKNHRVVLLSNTNAIHFEMIRRTYPLLRHFDAYVLSYEVGVMKPAPEIYEAAIASAGCRPEECFYTDDIPQYVEAAKRLGIDAVQFHSREQLEGELRLRGIKINSSNSSPPIQ